MWMRLLLPALTAWLTGTACAVAAERVDLELVLLADASGSIDDGEIRFQREGYARALTDPAILEAIAQGHDGRIAVIYVEWGSAASQDVGADSAGAFARSLLAAPRRAHGANAIGSALTIAQGLIEGNAIDGLRRVIDISADSANSWSGPPIEEARGRALAADVTINGLAILCREASCGGRPIAYDLEEAFARRIIGGPASFVVTAGDRASFADAVRRKLLLEIAGHGAGQQHVVAR
jgi:hypothetical protein